MKMTNQEIYTYALALGKAFTDSEQKLPVKMNFYLNKNKKGLMELAQDIEEARMEIIRANGTPTEDGTSYTIPTDKIPEVNQELNDLFSLEQEVTIYKVSIDSFSEDLTLTTGQMEAMMFMIE